VKTILRLTFRIDRKKVLKHHPDKKANSGDSNDDAFFKCIQKAYETMLHADRRRQFDSIDPYYIDLQDEVPSAQDIETSKNPEITFFKVVILTMI
jgi:DnaJ family protein C protein 2